jgi:hypothetical protein
MLRDALEAGRAESPSPAQLAGLATKLGILGAIGGAGAAGAAGAGGAAGASGAGAAGAAKAAGSIGAAGAAKAAGGVATVGAATKAAVGTGAALKIVAAVATTTALVVGGAVAVQKTTAPPAPPSAGYGLQASAARGSLPMQAAPPATSSEQGAQLAEPVDNVTAPAKPTSTAAATAHAAPLAPLEGEDEVRHLNEAHAALRSDPARALSLANQHAQRAPRGTLAQEREVIAIEALVKLGRATEARQRAARFEAAYPQSAQLRRVRALVGVEFDGGDHKR